MSRNEKHAYYLGIQAVTGFELDSIKEYCENTEIGRRGRFSISGFVERLKERILLTKKDE